MNLSKTLHNKYELIRKLGHGASGNVYLVQHRTLNLLRAVKIVSKQQEDAGHIINEALIIKNLNYQGIPIIYDIDEDLDNYYIFEEYVDGITLTQYTQNKSPSMCLSDIIRKAIVLCSQLDYLHQHGILHLDIKPDNIMIDNNDQLWLIDYDNAINLGETRQFTRGSAGFAAPQAYFGHKPDISWDIYSLGMILLYMSSGNIYSNVSTIHHQQLIPIIKKCTHHISFMRYRSAGAVKKDLETILRKKSNSPGDCDSLEINVGGTDRGVGVTHFCLALCSFLNRHKIPAIVINCSGTDVYTHMCADTANTKYLDNHIFSQENVHFISSQALIPLNVLSNYRIIIRDCGIQTFPYKPDIIVCSSLKPYNELFAGKLSLETYNQNQRFIIWNLCSTNNFYANVKKLQNTVNAYRMPCVYDIAAGLDLCDNMFQELLAEFNTDINLIPSKNKSILKFMKKGGL